VGGSRVSSASQRETVVIASDWLIAKRVMLLSDGSFPTSVMSVPCRVVSTLTRPSSISRARCALIAWGIA